MNRPWERAWWRLTAAEWIAVGVAGLLAGLLFASIALAARSRWLHEPADEDAGPHLRQIGEGGR